MPNFLPETISEAVSDFGLQEISYRSGDGISVSLFFDPEMDEVYIGLQDRKTALQTLFGVPKDSASDAFEHPFFYLP